MRIILIHTFLIACFIAIPLVVGASSHDTFVNPLGVSSISQLVGAIIEILLKILLPVIVVFVIYAGFLFVTAQGNEEKLNNAKKILLWTLVGAVIILGASVIAAVLENTVTQIKTGT